MMMHFSREHVDALREQSKRLFGNADTAQVILAIAVDPDGVVNATDLSWELQIANNRVGAQLAKLAGVGLLVPDPSRGGKKWYVRRKSPFWDACLRLHADWTGVDLKTGRS